MSKPALTARQAHARNVRKRSTTIAIISTSIVALLLYLLIPLTPGWPAVKKSFFNSEIFIKGIHQAGYATDPNYAEKVLRVKAKIDEMN